MIKLAEFKVLRFYDAAGVKRDIRRIPASQRRDFLALMALIAQLAEQKGGEISTLYDDDSPEFRDAVNDALGCFGISPEWVDMGMIRSLLFERDGKPGLLWELEFPDRKPPVGAKPLPDDIDPFANAVAALCGMFPDSDPLAIQEFVKITPWNEIEALLHARNWQITEANPKLKAEREKAERLAELRAEVKEELENGTFLESFAPPPGVFAAAMGAQR